MRGDNSSVITVKTLADFKRFLASPGATLQVIRHDFVTTDKAKPGFFEPKTVALVQSNAVKFSTGSWLPFGKAAHYRFTGSDEVTIALSDGVGPDPFAKIMTYKLTRAEAA